MWKKRCGRLRVLIPCAALLATVAAIAIALDLRVNVSYSLPLGLYQVTLDESAPLIEFCPAEPFASESIERGYRGRGLACADGAVPLLKPVVARAGDTVELGPSGLAVNGTALPDTAPLDQDGTGRPLDPWPAGRYNVEQGTVWVASSYNASSYDSRYIGPVETRLIRRRLRPIWCFKG